MDIKELHKKVRKIEIKTKGLTKQIFAGEYDSAFKGRGMSFSEVREYAYGDDVRNIDWNVTARTGDPFIKVFEEERELTVMLLIDVSKSMDFSTTTLTKRDLATEIAAIISFSASNNNDKVGAVFFSDKVEGYLPPQKGKKNILRIIRELINIESQGTTTDLNLPCNFLNNTQKKRSIAFLISDHIGEIDKNVVARTARKHDFIAFNLYDRSEREGLNFGSVQGVNIESGFKRGLMSFFNKNKSNYEKKFDDRQKQLNDIFRQSNADYIPLEVEDNYVPQLISFFKRR